jgi:plastocyanin
MKALSTGAAVLTGFFAVLALTAASGAADDVKVRIGNFAFIPATITVAAGTKVHWVNEDDVPHIVIGVDKDTPIKSPPLDTDDEYAVVLDKPGTYKYFCSLHPHMVGTVLVK